MSTKHITTDDLRRMGNSEGLILQGCGGDLQEWVDGINEMLTEEEFKELLIGNYGRSVIVRREKLCDNCQGKTVQAMTDDRAMLLELLDSLPIELQKAAFVQLSENLGKLPRHEIRTGPPHREIQRKRGAALADPDIPN